MRDEHRDDTIDALKGIGIILVLLGHFIEPYIDKSEMFRTIFIVIYSFHMPLFFLLSGLVAKKNFARNILYLTWIYVLYQLAYLFIVRIHYLKYDIASNRLFDTFIMPFWHMWFLYALIIYNFLLYVIDIMRSIVNRWMIIILAVGISLLSGYIVLDKGYGMMRVVTYFPIFLSGYLFKDEIRNTLLDKRWRCIALIAFMIGIMMVMLYAKDIKLHSLFNSQAYAVKCYNFLERLRYIAVGASLSLLLYEGLKDVSFSQIKRVGKDSLYLFLNHAFIFWIIQTHGFFKAIMDYSNWVIMMIVFLIVCGIIFIFSSEIVVNALDFIYRMPYRAYKIFCLRRQTE